MDAREKAAHNLALERAIHEIGTFQVTAGDGDEATSEQKAHERGIREGQQMCQIIIRNLMLKESLN